MSDSLLSRIAALFSVTDEQAMSRVRTHDDSHAFAELLKRWQGPIQRLCARMVGDVQRGEDLAQETFVRLFARRKDYEPKGRFSTFLWRVALNLCYDELRRIKRRREFSLDDHNGSSSEFFENCAVAETSPDEALIERERGDLVRQALLRLPENYRSVVVLRHYENLKFREIAEVLEIPEGTVKSRMAEALTKLSAMLRGSLEPKTLKGPIVCKTRIEENLVL